MASDRTRQPNIALCILSLHCENISSEVTVTASNTVAELESATALGSGCSSSKFLLFVCFQVQPTNVQLGPN